MMSGWGETALFCWGSTSHGQLGLGGIEEEQIFSPRQLHAFDNRQVREIACGQEHTLFLLEDGMLYSCGNNDTCQLGHSKSRTKPETIDTLEAQVIRCVSCGDSHSVAVTDTGQVFAWGNNRQGQLGTGLTDVTQSKTPKLVRSLSSHIVLQVSCGSNHTLALTTYGDVFAWGENSYGQLGIGSEKVNAYEPQLLTGLTGLTVAQVAAGGAHSFALTVSGALFGWGRNQSVEQTAPSIVNESLPSFSSFGQIGVGDESEHLSPTLCETLRSHKVKFVTCGENHSAVITKEGGVFTFGAGMYGQLGHNASNSEMLPKKVFELMGSEVSQLVCGRQHTLVFLPEGGRLCSFGLGVNGQLGLGTTSNRPSPSVVQGPFIPPGLSSSGTVSGSWVVKHVSSAGNQCFVVVTSPQPDIAPDDFRITDPECHVAVLTEERLNEYSSIPAERSPPVKLAVDIRNIFSSLSSLNGSFLLSYDDHCNCSSTRHGVNVTMAADYFAQLAKMSNSVVLLEMQEGLKQAVCANILHLSQDVEAMRFYLTLPYCHLFDEPQQFHTIIAPFSRVMLELKHAMVLEEWLGSVQPDQFTRYVHVYRGMLIYLLAESTSTSIHEPGPRSADIQLCLDVLSRLNKVNEEFGQLIPYETFHISMVKDKTDLRVDYVKWLQRTAIEVINLGHMQVADRGFYFCDYPFVFNAEAKTLLLQTDAFIQMQVAVDEVVRRNMTPMVIDIPVLLLLVKRTNLVSETIAQLAKQSTSDLKKPLKVVFLGEEGLDAGGVRKEFFLLLLQDLTNPKYGMFQYYEESRLLWFRKQTFEDSGMFFLVGEVCGLAIYNSTIIDLHFPLALYKKLLRRPITIEDMKELDPTVGKSLEDLLAYDRDDIEDVFCLNFQVTHKEYGVVTQVDLVPDGANIMVSRENRQQYVDAYLKYMFSDSVAVQLKAFFDGFHRVCGGRVLELFHPKELQAMVVGSENYDWEELEKLTEYKGEYTPTHPTVVFFWEVFHELSLQQRKKFLFFLTGSDRIPIHGMKVVKMFIQSTGGGSTYLPVAHTCFNLLDLPQYTDKAVLRDKLLQAMEETEGFGLV